MTTRNQRMRRVRSLSFAMMRSKMQEGEVYPSEIIRHISAVLPDIPTGHVEMRPIHEEDMGHKIAMAVWSREDRPGIVFVALFDEGWLAYGEGNADEPFSPNRAGTWLALESAVAIFFGVPGYSAIRREN